MVAVRLSSPVPPPLSVAVTVIEYSVPIFRLVSVYVVSLSGTSVLVLESMKQSVLLVLE